jgi:nitrogen fixation-related uncharacterized protein
MDEGTIALLITSLGVFAVFAGLFVWGLVTGQFRDVEEPKYRMLGTQVPAAPNTREDGNNDA